ncbi:MAG: hypothetical protein AB9836_02185 [Aminipila sp.]
MDYLKKTINNEEAYKRAQKAASSTNAKSEQSEMNNQTTESRSDNRQQ